MVVERSKEKNEQGFPINYAGLNGDRETVLSIISPSTMKLAHKLQTKTIIPQIPKPHITKKIIAAKSILGPPNVHP